MFINNVLSFNDGDDVFNYIQVVYNDGEGPINLRTVIPKRSCKRKIRNLADHKDFFVRIEYQ